ncbi:MAG: Ser-Thr-rich GPI-anchored membrane family protein [Candidatus Cloacimonetes bacterium]|nr:Ser-Thr-rich GPI-anchored membrane family protein [Candidatus Cloacimonadota bacterium]
MKKLYFIVLLTVLSMSLFSFTIEDYSFGSSAQAFSSIYTGPEGNPTVTWITDGDDELSSAIPLGFPFLFCGAYYTSIKISTDGFISLGTNLAISYPNNLLESTYSTPLIAPLWDDLLSEAFPNNSSTYVIYQNNVADQFKVEWRNVRWNFGGSSTYSQNFQLTLLANGVIKFNYGYSGEVNYPSASIGICENGRFISVTPNDGYSFTIANNDVAVLPTDRQFQFTPPPPAINISSPNGGESWQMGTIRSIMWTPTNLTGNAKIELIRGSTIVSVISSSAPANNGLLSWLIPTTLTPAADYMIKISSLTHAGVFDFSNSTFSIVAQAEPSITVISPDGTEAWQVGTVHQITWTSSFVTGNAKIELCQGAALNVVSTISSSILLNNATVLWTVPITLSAATDYKIKITSLTHPNIYGTSSNYFTVTANPGISITSPNGGESWQTGTAHAITWTFTDLNGNVKIELLQGNNPTAVLTINSSSPINTGNLYWTIPSDLAPGADYKIKISSLSNSSIIDYSDSFFTITAASLTLISPNGLENWQMGTIHGITWSAANLTGNVKIELFRGTSATVELTISSSVTIINETLNWTIPSSLTPASDYKVKISSLANPSLYDYSNDYFSISVPALTLVSPNGGEYWQITTTHAITWTSASLTGNVKLELCRGANHTVVSTISSSVAVSIGAINWMVPVTLTPATDYSMKISFLNNQEFYDYSDNYFSIESDPQLSLSSPNGGEYWQMGTVHAVSWSYANLHGNVKLELCQGANATVVATIISSMPISNGTIMWTVPVNLSPAADYKVKISYLSDNTIYDYSDNYFSISVPLIILTSPNGSENWQRGTSHTITWTVDNLAGYVKFELLRATSEAVVATIISSINASSGAFDWMIPTTITPAADYRVKISSLSNQDFCDYSDNYFSINADPTVTISSPNGSESWKMGSIHPVSWTYANLGGYVKLELCQGNDLTVVSSIIDSIAIANGTINWTIPTNLVTSADYKVKISSLSDINVYDYSDYFFSLTSPYIAVISPNGSESWIKGTTQSVTWAAVNLSGNVKLELCRGADASVVVSIISSVAVITGHLSWEIPSSLPPAADYRVRISSVNVPDVYDYSDGYFSLTYSTAPIALASDILQIPPFIYPNTSVPYEVKSKYFDPDGINDLKFAYLRIINPYGHSLTLTKNLANDFFYVGNGNTGANFVTLLSVTKVFTTSDSGLLGWELTWSFVIHNTTWGNCQSGIKFAVLAQDTSGHQSNNGAWQESTNNSSFGYYGITFICRGYNGIAPLQKEGWMQAMATAIKDRLGGHAFIGTYNPGTGLYDTFYGTADFWEQKEIILLFDWMQDSQVNSSGFSEAAADAAFASLMRYANLPNFNNLHFIGHSRGAVLVSEITERLLNINKPVRQITYLDPRDWGLGSIMGDFDVNSSIVNPTYPNLADIPQALPLKAIIGWEAVPFKETIFQRQGYDSPAIYTPENINGRAVPGTANCRFLDEYFVTHSTIIDQYISTIQNSNYILYINPGGSPTDNLGFQRSRIGNCRLGIISSFPVTGSATSTGDYDSVTSGIYNGDFSRIGTNGVVPGWDFHGGDSSQWSIVHDLWNNNYYAKLTKNEAISPMLKHNRVYVAAGDDYLNFKYSVPFASSDAQLLVCINNDMGVLSIPLVPTDGVFIERSIDIRKYQRTACSV